MKVLMIGGTRFIGPRVVAELGDQGHEITVLHRGETEHPDVPAEVTHLHGDLRDSVFLSEASKTEPDVVIHMLAMQGAHMATAMKAFVGRAGQMIAISSMDVYLAYDISRGVQAGPPIETPMSEDAPLRSKSFPYRDQASDEKHMLFSYDKIPVEDEALSYAELPGTALRLPAVYGPDDGQHRFLPYVKRMIDGRPAILLDQRTERWCWTRGFVSDVAHAIAIAATSGGKGSRIYNVGEETALTEAEWIRLFAQATGWEGEVVFRPSEDLPKHLQVPENFRLEQDFVTSTSKIRADLGFKEVVTREEAVVRTLEWEASTPPEGYDLSTFDYAAEDAAVK